MALARNINRKQAQRYFEKDDYYAVKALNIPGLEQYAKLTWGGSLAKSFGLIGQVDQKDMKNVLDGRYPDGTVLVGRKEKDGTETKRAGTDIVFEAPKSWSIAALEGGDTRLIDIHNKVARELAEETEKTVGCRRGKGGARFEQTGESLYASVLHIVNREQEPHLHTHTVFFNVTRNEEGKLQRATMDLTFASQTLLQAKYHARLAEEASKAGYTVTFDKDYIPQLSGFTREHNLAHSTRTQKINEELEKRGLTREEATAKLKDMINKKTRKKKEDITQDTPKKWKEASRAAGFDTEKALNDSRTAARDIELRGDHGNKKAVSVLEQALGSLTERNFITKKEKVLARALELAKGSLKADRLEKIYEEMVENGKIVEAKGDKRKGTALTTQNALETERNIQRIEKSLRNTFKPVLSDEKANELLETKYTHLSEEQKNVFRQIVTTRDGMTFISGAAGTGKTTTLNPGVLELSEAGKEVVGLGPQWSAVMALKDVGLTAKTTDSFIINVREHGGFHPNRIYLVDEAGLLGSKKMEKLMEIAEKQGARVVYAGDTKQYQSVLAGSGAELLENNGISTVKLTKMVRQAHAPTPVKEAAQAALEDGRKALEILDKAGLVKEYKDPASRACEKIMEEGGFKGAFVVAATHKTISEITKRAREVTGQTQKEQHKLKVFVQTKELTDSDANNIEILGTEHTGSTLKVGREYKHLGLQKGDFVTLEKVMTETKTLVLRDENGRELTTPASRFKRYEVGTVEERPVALGERLRVAGNGLLDEDILKHTKGTLEKIENGKGLVTLDNGKQIEIDMNKPQELEYGYAGTGHTHQGLTGERVYLVYKDTDYVEKRHFYTDLTRTKDKAMVFTNDTNKLYKKVEKTVEKTKAHDIYKEHSGHEGR